MGDGGDCEMRGVGMHGSATGTAEPGEPGGAAQAVGGMRERGGVQEAQDARDAREVPLDARVEECPATDELRASFRSAINRILAQSHGIYVRLSPPLSLSPSLPPSLPRFVSKAPLTNRLSLRLPPSSLPRFVS
ncbi:unnamed protein product [Closterium sp. NIES-53]